MKELWLLQMLVDHLRLMLMKDSTGVRSWALLKKLRRLEVELLVLQKKRR